MNDYPQTCMDEILTRIRAIETVVSGNGLAAQIDYVQSEAFALKVGEMVAAYAWQSLGKALLRVGAGALSVSGIAGLLAVLKVTGII